MSGGGGGGSFNPSSIPPLPPNRVRRSQAGHRSDGGGKEGEGGELKRHFMTRKPSQHEAMQARASEALRKESISSRSGGNRGEGLSDNQPMWSRKSSGRESVHMADNPLAIEMMAASEVEEEVEEVSTPRGDGVKVLGPDGQSMSPGTQERRRSAKKPLSARKSGRRMSDVAVGSLTMEDDGTRITEDLDTMDELRLPAPKRISGNWAI